MQKTYFTYILSNPNRTVLYIGVTNDLVRRVIQHKSGRYDGFSKEYIVRDLVYFEETPSIVAAIEREKQLKRWRRSKKDWLIDRKNPERRDLFAELCQVPRLGLWPRSG